MILQAVHEAISLDSPQGLDQGFLQPCDNAQFLTLQDQERSEQVAAPQASVKCGALLRCKSLP